MTRLRHTLAIACMLVSGFTTSPMAQANPAVPQKLWDGFSAPTGIATTPDGTVYVSNCGSGTVERIRADGSRSTALDGIASPAGIAVDAQGAVFVASYSGDYVVRLVLDGTRTRVVEGLATPTGLAFASDGRLLVANRAAGEVLSIDLSNGSRRVVARALTLPVGVIEMADGSLITSQYGGRVTRIWPDDSTQALGQSFVRPGVGIVTDGPDAAFVIDNGASSVRRIDLAGHSTNVAQGFDVNPVALGRARDGNLLVGVWGSGSVYRVVIDPRR